MKRTMLVLAAAMTVFAAAATAQSVESDRSSAAYFSTAEKYQTADLKMVKNGLIDGLKSDNEGLVLSSLAHAAYMRIALPAEEMAEFEREIQTLIEYGSTGAVRARAALAERVFQNPGIFSDLTGKRYETSDAFFADVSARILSVQL